MLIEADIQKKAEWDTECGSNHQAPDFVKIETFVIVDEHHNTAQHGNKRHQWGSYLYAKQINEQWRRDERNAKPTSGLYKARKSDDEKNGYGKHNAIIIAGGYSE